MLLLAAHAHATRGEGPLRLAGTLLGLLPLPLLRLSFTGAGLLPLFPLPALIPGCRRKRSFAFSSACMASCLFSQ